MRRFKQLASSDSWRSSSGGSVSWSASREWVGQVYLIVHRLRVTSGKHGDTGILIKPPQCKVINVGRLIGKVNLERGQHHDGSLWEDSNLHNLELAYRVGVLPIHDDVQVVEGASADWDVEGDVGVVDRMPQSLSMQVCPVVSFVTTHAAKQRGVPVALLRLGR